MGTEIEIEDLVRGFEETTLPRADWTHRSHLRVALWYVCRHGRAEATERIRAGIRRYNLSQGNPDGYHETITLAWVAVIDRFLGRLGRARPIADLAVALLAECGEPGYLLRYYSRELLGSAEARRRWVPPDRRPIEEPPMSTEIAFAIEPDLDAAEFVDVLERSTLAERRPVGEPETIRGMLGNAGVIVTARAGGRLVGVSRAITDFHYCTYLSDLAVDVAYQGRGIGRELIRRTHEAAGLGTLLILLAAPKARTYYPHVGMLPHDSCWIIPARKG
jgi:ribosomal protein S18 acetylase RimI-like enzyme